MDVLTVIYTHLPYEDMSATYNWHKKLLGKVKIIWDISDIDGEEIGKMKEGEEEDVIPMKIENLWALHPSFDTNLVKIFEKENPTYFNRLESDVIMVDKDYEEKAFKFVEKHKIFAVFPYLRSRWTDPEHPFSKGLQSVKAYQWTIPAMNLVHREALLYYRQTLVTHPNFWCEIRYPSLLGEAGFHITSNPFLEAGKSFRSSPGNRQERKHWDLPDEVIEEAILVDRVAALHPIKNLAKKIPFIEELVLKRKNLDKKEKKD